MSCDEVAKNSIKLANKYIQAGNYGRAFSHYLVAFKLKPEWKTEFKQEFSSVLCKWGTILDEKKKFEDLFTCYEHAMEVFPDDVLILNNLGCHLLRCGFHKEATQQFRKCLTIDPFYLRAVHNLENAVNAMVERWHFRMLNDQRRNEAYREAIMKKIKQGFDTVLDVGTGTGLLSLFCCEGKARKIYACDSSPTMAEICEQVFHFNQASHIQLIKKHSSQLRIPQDISCKVSLLVTETFDAGLLGEDILNTLAHAWDHLLLPPNFGVVIPLSATLYVTGIELDPVANDFQLKQTLFENISVFQDGENYDTHDLSRSRFVCLTQTGKITEIDFNSPKDIAEALQGWKRKMTLRCRRSGRLDCFAVWFDLHLDKDIILRTSPFSKSNTAWDQAIFRLPRSVQVEEKQEVTVTVSIENGQLNIKCNGYIGGHIVSEDLIKTLKNEKLAESFNQVVGKLKHSFSRSVNVLDCYPFPVFGLNFILNRRDRFKDELTCLVTTENDRHFVNFMSEKHGVEVDVVTKTEDLAECFEGKKFDVILLTLVEMSGEVKDEDLLQLNNIKSLLNPGGIILPEDVTVMGQFVYSDWLTKSSRVLNNSVTCGYKIAEFINPYQVQHYIDLDLKSVKAVACSKTFKLFTILDFMESVIKTSAVRHPAAPSAITANAMVYWFKIRFTEGCDEIVTSDSQYHQAAFLFSEIEFPKILEFNIIRNSGLFRIELLNN